MKKKFKFKLDGLLKVREFKEKKLKTELGEILTEIQEVEESISVMHRDIEDSYKSQEDFLKSPTTGQMAQFFPRFIKTRKDDIKNKENLLFALQKRYQNKLQELAAAKGQVKVIENLKDKKKTEHKKEIEKKQQEELDEFVILKKAREA
jgi:flagellar FliJ protein